MKSYLITDPKQYHDFENSLKKALIQHSPDFICFRDKRDQNHSLQVESFIDIGRKLTRATIIIHSYLDLALQYKADGIHVSSYDFKTIALAKEKNLYVVASTHNIEEAKSAISYGADALTYSPIFDTPGKGKPVGLENLKEIIDIIDAPIFALGGIITQEHILALEEVHPYGFASIRYFL